MIDINEISQSFYEDITEGSDRYNEFLSKFWYILETLIIRKNCCSTDCECQKLKTNIYLLKLFLNYKDIILESPNLETLRIVIPERLEEISFYKLNNNEKILVDICKKTFQ